LDLANSSFFSLLRGRLDQLSQRQRLISENIANASTPGYKPRDLDTSGFERMLAERADGSQLHVARTNPLHMVGGAGSVDTPIVTGADSETTIDGNAVVLEDEMSKEADVRMQFETGIALYQKGLSLVRMAIKAPGR